MTESKLLAKRTLINLETDQIPGEPGRFCMSYGFDNSELIKSISQVGIINAPCILRNNENAIEVITGFRRVLALKELKVREVECFDLTDSNMSTYDMLNLSVNDNLFCRKFNFVEKSLILNKLTKIVKDNNLINKFNSLLNVNKKEFDLILKIESLDESIKEFIAFETLNLKTLDQLLQLQEENLLICANWINNLNLNYNSQIQFIDYISDISRIEQVDIKDLLKEEYFLNLLEEKRKNTPQKAKELMDYLRKRRNPDFTKYQHIFEKKVKRLQLPANTKIKHHRFFESELYQLEVEFKDGNELNKSLKELIDREGLTSLNDPWFEK